VKNASTTLEGLKSGWGGDFLERQKGEGTRRKGGRRDFRKRNAPLENGRGNKEGVAREKVRVCCRQGKRVCRNKGKKGVEPGGLSRKESANLTQKPKKGHEVALNGV